MVSLLPLITLACSVLSMAVKPDAHVDVTKRSTPKVLKLDFNVERNFTRYQKRDETASANLDDSRDIRYFMDLYLGSNKQKIRVDIDTGSSDLWVHDEFYGPSWEGMFNQSQSSSFKYLPEAFSILYLDGSTTLGLYAEDTVSLEDGTSLSNFQFAVVNKSNSPGTPAIFGISRKVQELAKTKYDNFPYALVSQGIIDKPAYSIYMSKDQGDKGLVLFGGIDNKKYLGELATFPISDNWFASITLEEVNVNGKTFYVGRPALLDTGTSWLVLPDEIIDDLTEKLGGDVHENGDIYISCDQPTDEFITFNFGTQEITISYADLIVRPFQGSCLAGMSKWDPKNGPILGDVFLRHTYTVYDLEENTISIAPAVDTDESDVVQI